MNPYYEDEAVTIYHADYREVLPSLVGVDFVLSDPPYGISWNTDSTRFTKGNTPLRGPGRSNWGAVKGDSTAFDPSPWVNFPSVILWGANHFAQGMQPGTWLVWMKKLPELFGTFLSNCELAWMNKGHGVYAHYRPFPPASRIREGGQSKLLHPTQKPLTLMKWCLDFFPDAQIILDPFMGSGTTLRAAKDLGRKAVGIEIEERYCEVAVKRMSQSVLSLELA